MTKKLYRVLEWCLAADNQEERNLGYGHNGRVDACCGDKRGGVVVSGYERYVGRGEVELDIISCI